MFPDNVYCCLVYREQVECLCERARVENENDVLLKGIFFLSFSKWMFIMITITKKFKVHAKKHKATW